LNSFEIFSISFILKRTLFKGRSVARCLEPHFVNLCYIIIILQPKAQNWFFSASVLRQKLRRAIINYEFI